MKKITVIAAIGLLVFSLFSCSKKKDTPRLPEKLYPLFLDAGKR